MSAELREATSRLSMVSVVVIGLAIAVFAHADQLGAAVDNQADRLSDSPQGPIVLPKIDRQPKPADLKRGLLQSFPKHSPGSTNAFEVDLRSYDLSKLDLVSAADDLGYAMFDDRTAWPASDCLPEDFDPRQVMETAENPGLGVRSLHAQGITGQGVGIAIIDNPLLANHIEYADRLRLYEETNVLLWNDAHMHGPAVASIAAGKTVGVAPGADLYYIGRWAADVLGTVFKRKQILNFTHGARAINRILQINEQLPDDRKIRVISISIGWDSSQKGYQEMTDAAQKAKAAGMLVICSSVEEVHGFKFHGLARDLSGDPDDFNSYRPASWGRRMYAGRDRLLVPMGTRTTASPTGKDEYVFYGRGGWSWAIPYIAGAYALAAQVEPNVTPDRFWALAMKTGRVVEREDVSLGPILDPVKLIAALKAGELADPEAVEAELKKSRTVSKRQSDIPAKMEQLDVNNATPQDVIELFGLPQRYGWGRQTFDPCDLPDRYIMNYPQAFRIVIMRDRIVEVRFDQVDVGYTFRDTIRTGSTLDDVLKVLGSPTKVVTGQKNEWEEGVLYQDIDGVKGNGYYARSEQGVRMFLRNDRVVALYITRTDPLPGHN
jgi:Subtilase family